MARNQFSIRQILATMVIVGLVLGPTVALIRACHEPVQVFWDFFVCTTWPLQVIIGIAGPMPDGDALMLQHRDALGGEVACLLGTTCGVIIDLVVLYWFLRFCAMVCCWANQPSRGEDTVEEHS